ncbi:MAG: NAD(P)-dependent alcohol dehydrogenase [Candidatus Nitrosocosmicus sp.]
MERTIVSARIHEYQKPLSLDNIQLPKIAHGEEVLVKVGAAGLCHSDLHLINGEWKDVIPIELPKTPGHEVAGWVEETGNSVPSDLLEPGDLVAIFGGWGCGACFYCKSGDEQMCSFAKWPGLSSFDGGYSEFILVPSYRFLVKVDKNSSANPENLAPLTDAGLTPYRAIKKIRSLLGPGKSIAIFGIGGLGSYGVQYAKILGGGATVISLDRTDEKLELAKSCGSDYVVKIKNTANIKDEAMKMTSGKGIDVVIDCVGTENTVSDSIRILAKGGAIVVVGLFGNLVKVPVAPLVLNEYKIGGSLWGSYNELREVIELQKQGKIRNNIRKFKLDEINQAIDLLKQGQIVGRGVIIP